MAMAGWTALGCCHEEGEQLQQLQQLDPLYDSNEDNNNNINHQQLSNEEEEEEEGGKEGGIKKKRATNYQLSMLFPTLFTPRAYFPPPKGSPRVQAKPVFAYDPYYLVRI